MAFLIAVAFSGWFGGAGPALVAMVLSFLLAVRLPIPAPDQLGRLEHAAWYALYTVTGLTIILLTESQRRTKRRAEASAVQVQEAEKAVRESKRLFHDLLEKVEDCAILTLDKEGRITTWNAGVKRVLGYEEEELLGQNASILYTPEDREQRIPERELERARTGGRASDDRWLLRKDGVRFWAEGVATVILDDAGGLQGFTKVLRDRTEHRRREDELRLHLAELQAMYETAVAATRAPAVEEIYEAALNGLQSAIKADRVALLLFDPDGVVRFKAWKGLSSQYRSDTEGHSPWPADAKDPQPILVSDIHDEPSLEALRPVILAEGIQALGFIPLVGHTRLLGKLMIYYDSPHVFSEREVRVTQTIASHISFAIERRSAEQQIKTSLKEKEVLLREIHHRVKNNLQIVSSLLNLQAEGLADTKIKLMYQDIQGRIRSMALIHTNLYESRDVSTIDFAAYVRRLTMDLFRSYGVDLGVVTVSVEIDSPAHLPLETAVPLGLIIHELVSNALKYAFPEGRQGNIRIACVTADSAQHTLTISDNGVGLPEDFDVYDAQTLGLQLVVALAEQLNGGVRVRRNGGTSFEITFSEIHYERRY